MCPMAGITDSAFRLLNKLGGTDLVYSEMAHVNAISYNSPKTLKMLKASPFEFPYIVQLFGKDPKYFAEAAKIISKQGIPTMQYKPFTKKQLEFINQFIDAQQNEALKIFLTRFAGLQKELKEVKRPPKYVKPSGLDINLGCPAKKVFGHGGGAALWKDLDNVRNVIGAVLKNTKLPVSIKVRTGVGKVTLLELLDTIKDLPIKRVMIHGRTYTQGFSGPIDTALIKKIIKEYPQFEFWINGGIVDPKSALEAANKTGCSNLGVARGTYGNPLLAEEIKLKQTDKYSVNEMCILAYVHSLLNYQSKGQRGIIEMRKHLAWYFKDFPGAKKCRKKLVQVNSLNEIQEALLPLKT